MSNKNHTIEKVRVEPLMNRFNEALSVTGWKESTLSREVFGNGNRFSEIKNDIMGLTLKKYNAVIDKLDEIIASKNPPTNAGTSAGGER